MPTPYDTLSANLRTAILAFAQRVRDVSQAAENADLAQNALKLDGLSLAQVVELIKGAGYAGTVKDLETQLLTFIARTDNPHNVTKAQVGLGDVQNFGIATKAEAENKLVTNVYMTPERTWDALMYFWADQVGASPETLNTISELAAALKNDPDIINALETSVASKVDTVTFNTTIGNLNTALANLAANIATDAEILAGVNDTKFVTPRGAAYQKGLIQDDVSTHITALTAAFNDDIGLIDAP